MRNALARRVAFTGMLFALAIALSFFESAVTPLLGLPPGVKPGLANVVVMFALLSLSHKQAVLLVVLKAGFALLTRGPVAGLLSLCGGLLAIGVMLLLLRLWPGVSVLLLSLAGAIAHNVGQLLVVGVLLGWAVLVYAPVLLLAGIAMGALNAFLLRLLLPALAKMGLGKKQK